jgi:hypothetical protein
MIRYGVRGNKRLYVTVKEKLGEVLLLLVDRADNRGSQYRHHREWAGLG